MIKSCGYRTKNVDGKFEVTYKLDSWLREVFGLKTEFTFTTDSVEMKTNKYLSDRCGLIYNWFDEGGNLVTDTKTLEFISETINQCKKF